ncbi:MAG TPA: YciI family protein [Burkholderiales bacterium]|nr:YciI family protein [Burkholderiales bacterium]
MLYAIIGEDAGDSMEKRKRARPSNLARLEELKEEGRLILAGPFPSDDGNVSGSLIVAEFDSIDAAKAWADADPYVRDAVFGKVEVKPFRKVLP